MWVLKLLEKLLFKKLIFIMLGAVFATDALTEKDFIFFN